MRSIFCGQKSTARHQEQCQPQGWDTTNLLPASLDPRYPHLLLVDPERCVMCQGTSITKENTQLEVEGGGSKLCTVPRCFSRLEIQLKTTAVPSSHKSEQFVAEAQRGSASCSKTTAARSSERLQCQRRSWLPRTVNSARW